MTGTKQEAMREEVRTGIMGVRKCDFAVARWDLVPFLCMRLLISS